MPAGLARLRRELRYWRGRLLPVSLPRRSQKKTTSCVTTLCLAEPLSIDVYWLEFENNQGPSASVYVLGQEVLRFDCFGANTGHLHVNLIQHRRYFGSNRSRLFFVAQDVEGQIQEAAHWLRQNLAFCLVTNHAKAVRTIDIPATLSGQAADQMVAALQAVQRQHQS